MSIKILDLCEVHKSKYGYRFVVMASNGEIVKPIASRWIPKYNRLREKFLCECVAYCGQVPRLKELTFTPTDKGYSIAKVAKCEIVK